MKNEKELPSKLANSTSSKYSLNSPNNFLTYVQLRSLLKDPPRSSKNLVLRYFLIVTRPLLPSPVLRSWSNEPVGCHKEALFQTAFFCVLLIHNDLKKKYSKNKILSFLITYLPHYKAH